MKKRMLIGTIALVAGSLLAADPKDDVAAAAGKLADAGNYSWTATMDLGPNSQFTPGPTEGKVDKDGLTWLSVTFNDNTTEAVKKGDKIAVKGEDGWTAADASADNGGGGGGGGGRNPVTMMTRRLQNFKAPAAEVQDLISKTKEITKDGDAYSGALTEDGAKALLAFRGRRGGNTSSTTDVKGSVKFWIKDGALSKYETKVSGKRERNGEEQQIQRTTTVVIKDVGATKITLPDEAKNKLS